jgi:hypothetical protein
MHEQGGDNVAAYHLIDNVKRELDAMLFVPPAVLLLE